MVFHELFVKVKLNEIYWIFNSVNDDIEIVPDFKNDGDTDLLKVQDCRVSHPKWENNSNGFQVGTYVFSMMKCGSQSSFKLILLNQPQFLLRHETCRMICSYWVHKNVPTLLLKFYIGSFANMHLNRKWNLKIRANRKWLPRIKILTRTHQLRYFFLNEHSSL